MHANPPAPPTKVLARRAAVCYLYDQLEMAVAVEAASVSSSGSIFRLVDRAVADGAAAAGATRPVFELADGITLHLYTSSAPCGNVQPSARLSFC